VPRVADGSGSDPGASGPGPRVLSGAEHVTGGLAGLVRLGPIGSAWRERAGGPHRGVVKELESSRAAGPATGRPGPPPRRLG
jgi:hypothetical protein